MGVDCVEVARQRGEQGRLLGRDPVDGLVLGRGEGEEVRRDPVEVAVLDSLELLVHVEVKAVEVTAALVLGLPHAVHDVLDGDAVVGLAVPRVAEGHQRRVDLCDGREGQVRRPVLDEDHVAGEHAGGIGAGCEYRRQPGWGRWTEGAERERHKEEGENELTSRVRLAPEHNQPVLILLGAQDLVELDGKPVQVPDVQRPKVVVEGVIQQ